MSHAGYPFHHTHGVCTIVHYSNERVAEDYCTVCHAAYMCAGVVQAFAEDGPLDWAEATGRCPHPRVNVSECDARDDAKKVPPGHEWPLKDCVEEHYEVPDSFRTGEFWHDTAVVYHRCRGCGRTDECNSVRFKDRPCQLATIESPTMRVPN